MFDGRCVKTIVFRSPKRRAIVGAARKERGGQEIGAKKDTAQGIEIGFIAEIEPIGDDTLHDEATGERIQGEKSCQLRHDPTGSLHVDHRGLRNSFGFRFNGR